MYNVRRFGIKIHNTEEQLGFIFEELKSGKIGQREAEKKYGIPKNTLKK